MKRETAVCVILGLAIGVIIGVAIAAERADATPVCHIVVDAGIATAVDCPADSNIATYTYRPGAEPGPFSPDSLPQTLFDHGATSARVPDCAFQADVFTGQLIQVIDVDHLYGSTHIVYAVNGGTKPCESITSTTSSSTTTTTTGSATSSSSPSTPTPVTLARTGTSHNGPLSLTAFVLVGGGGMLVAAAKRKASA